MSYVSRQRRTGWRLLEGDSQNLLKLLAPNSVDAMVTDPPCGIGFMNLKFDQDRGGRDQWIMWLSGILRECHRVLKPGGHALIWGLPRTAHWTTTAVEDSGFQIRDMITHIFATGFPKSFSPEKELKKRGASPSLIKKYAGYGTALKPACEFWILARKPLTGIVVDNIATWGTGALNIDGCRIGQEKITYKSRMASSCTQRNYEHGYKPSNYPHTQKEIHASVTGRWPANLVLSHAEQCGSYEVTERPLFGKQEIKKVWQCVEGCPVKALNAQAGKEASHFFYCAKPSNKERNAGCDSLPTLSAGERVRRKEGSAGMDSPRAGAGRTSGSANHHPTLKSIALMRYLIRIITPPGGTVLDPFAGSGTTGCAARLEGFRFVGIEKEQDYSTIARARIAHWNKEVQLPK